jgi:hypothetical protein
MTDQGIQAVGLEDAAKQLREKIRLAFVELIPKEQWEAMVKAELESFTKERTGHDNWNHKVQKPSVFHEVAEEVYRAHVKALVKAELDRPEFAAAWNKDQQRHTFSEAVEAWLTKNREAILHTMLQEMMGSVAQNMIERLRNGT